MAVENLAGHAGALRRVVIGRKIRHNVMGSDVRIAQVAISKAD